MTKYQYKKARAILAKDCGLRKRYYRKGGLTCAIGALALASGVTKQDLKEVNTFCIESFECITIAKKIKKKFGMSDCDLSYIQDANDNHTTRKSRVKAVLGQLDRATID